MTVRGQVRKDDQGKPWLIIHQWENGKVLGARVKGALHGGASPKIVDLARSDISGATNLIAGGSVVDARTARNMDPSRLESVVCRVSNAAVERVVDVLSGSKRRQIRGEGA